MNGVNVGDLVKWQTPEKTKVGVVLSVNGDGTCTIDITEKGVRRNERIRTERLEVITSTVEPKAKTPGAEGEGDLAKEKPGSPPLEPPFQED